MGAPLSRRDHPQRPHNTTLDSGFSMFIGGDGHVTHSSSAGGRAGVRLRSPKTASAPSPSWQQVCARTTPQPGRPASVHHGAWGQSGTGCVEYLAGTCTHTCTCFCIYVCVCVYMIHTCINAHMACKGAYTHVHKGKCIVTLPTQLPTLTDTHTHTCACIHVCTCAQVFPCACTHMHVQPHTLFTSSGSVHCKS